MASPISSLPLEVLEHIFALCVAWLYADTPQKHPLNFTEVSRTWHCTALTSPRLWSLIDLANAPLTHYVLTVARRPHANAPLSLMTRSSGYVRTSLSHIGVACASLVAHAKNRRTSISTIDVCLYPCVLSSLLAALISPVIDFAHLTRVTLRVPPVGHPSPFFASPSMLGDELNSAGGLSLPVAIPNVHHLELEGVSVHWASIKNLRYLCLRNLICAESSLTVGVLHALLRRSQSSLEYCRLENNHFSAPGTHFADKKSDTYCSAAFSESPSAIYLPRLHTLSISASPAGVASILRPLSLSPTTNIQLYTSLRDDLHTLFSPSFQVDGKTVTGLRLSSHSAAFRRPDASVAALSISSGSPSPLAPSILHSLFYSTIYALSSLRTLIFAPGVLLDIPPSSLTHLFNASYGALNLRELGVGYQCDVSMLYLLESLLPPNLKSTDTCVPPSPTRSSAADKTFRASFPCPNLQTLSFNVPGSFKWHGFADVWLDSVLDVIALRGRPRRLGGVHIMGPRLQRLEFLKCHGVNDVEFVRARMPCCHGEMRNVDVVVVG